MAQASESVITKERFAKGKTYQEYLDTGVRNREQFDDNYSSLQISDEQRAALRELVAHANGPDHMVIIARTGALTFYRGMPVGARIAEAMGIEVRVFERDQNKDMIAEYLKDGEFESIPVFVFYDAEHTELGHFIERPTLANEQMGELQSVLGDMRPRRSRSGSGTSRAKRRFSRLAPKGGSATWNGSAPARPGPAGATPPWMK